MAGAVAALVVDASVAVKWHVPDEAAADRAVALLEQFDRAEVALLAPYHIRYEVASAVATATLGRQPRLSREQGEAATAEFLAVPIQTYLDARLIPAAFALVHEFGCACYDALYLALAVRLGVPFVTADRKLYERVGHLPELVWIAAYPPSASV